jgi:hypothetical protein
MSSFCSLVQIVIPFFSISMTTGTLPKSPAKTHVKPKILAGFVAASEGAAGFVPVI